MDYSCHHKGFQLHKNDLWKQGKFLVDPLGSAPSPPARQASVLASELIGLKSSCSSPD